MVLKFRWETEFKETEIGEIPKEWEVKRLEEITTVESGGSAPQGERYFINGKYPFVRVKHLNNDKYIQDYDLINDEAVKDYNLRLFKKKTIVFPRSGESINLGKYNMIPFDSYIVNHLAAVKNIENVSDIDFVFYMLTLFDNFAEESVAGTTLPYLRISDISKRKIVFPPLPEQSRIATVLSWFDDLIENKKKQNEILEKTAMAIFKNWFIDFEPFKGEEFVFNEELGKEIPRGWEVKRLGEVVKFLYGEGLPERNRKEGIYPVVGSSGIIGFHSQYIAEPPTIIIGRKGNAGSIQLFLEYSFPIDTVFYSSKYTLSEVIFYIYHLLKVISLEDMALTDTAVPGLNIHMLNSLIVFLPPPHILQSFHSLVEPLFQKIILNQKQIMTLRKIRDTLLPLLVFGKLRVEEI